MNRSGSIIVIILLLAVMAESKGQRQAGSGDIITVDVTKSYLSKKELILQDFTDVEYVALETNDDFVNQGIVMDVGKKIILVRNLINDGDIFVYDRTGKALRKINHKGHQTSKEYTNILGITLDEDNNEMFVNDYSTRRILVYDLYGKFKRSFKHKENDGNQYFTCYTSIFNYDRDNLICYDENNDVSRTFVIISKKNGSITKEIKIPFIKKHIPLTLRSKNGTQYTSVSPNLLKTIIPFKGNWTLVELSSDTVYTFLPDDYNLRPFLVRTPSIQSIDPKVFLLLSFFSDRYYFMETMKYVYDWNTRTGLPRTSFMYDKQEKAFLGYTVYNGDYTTKKEVLMNAFRPVNHGIESLQRLEAYQLVESYKKGELKGKLKETAATLDEDDNPVIMLIRHKK
ncbi:MAG: 6-bladed beta-propeller [Bacteroidales bacterium]|jgi:hypothetical protein|nr:6-bladed beta-propeller [Bacteroidales bacterium]